MDGISGTAQPTKRQPAAKDEAARIQARYWIETAFPLEDAAEIMAGEQSTGTFVRVPGETSELRARFAAKVEQITELETVDRPSLPGSGAPTKNSSPQQPPDCGGYTFVAAGESRPIAAQPSGDGRGQPF